MPFTKMTDFTFSHAAQEDTPDLTPTQVKADFDSRGDEIKTYLDAHIDELTATTDSASGADNVGMTAVAGLTGTTVQTIIESLRSNVYLKAETYTQAEVAALLAGVVLGQIPDGSLTTAKYADNSVTAAKCAADVATGVSVAAAISDHAGDIASASALGHFKVGARLTIDGDGVLSADVQVPTVPSCRVTNTAAQSIANATETALAFDTERFDTDTIHDPVTATTRLTCKTAGKYLIIGNVKFAANATGVRELSIRLNGTSNIACVNREGSGILNVSTVYTLALNDYVELCVCQASGGALDTAVINYFTPDFMMIKVG